MTRKNRARALCEAIEPRRYLSVSFGIPNKLSVTGVTSPVDEVFWKERINNSADLAFVATATAVQILIGNDDGTFSLGSSVTLPTQTATITPFLLGNFNGTGSQDMVQISQIPGNEQTNFNGDRQHWIRNQQRQHNLLSQPEAPAK